MRTLQYYAFIVYFALLIFLSFVFISPLPIFLSLPFLWLIVFSEFRVGRKIDADREYEEKRYMEGNVTNFKYEIQGKGYYIIRDSLNELRGYCHDRCVINKKTVLSQFGKISFKYMEIYFEDFLGMIADYKKKKDSGELRVYPRIEYMRKLRIKPRKTRNLLGDYPSRRKGRGLEFTDIREYVPGDEMRRVNWKASARRNELMVNEYESERTGDTVILLDVRRFYKGEEEYEKLLKASVRAAATIATYLSRTRSRVGIVLLGESVDWIYPTYGKRAMYLILDRLLYVRSREISHLSFDYGKFIVSRFFPPNSFVILISPLLSWDIDDAIVELLAKNYDILVISPTLVGEKKDLASQILRMEREVRLRRLRVYARVVDWDISYPLTSVLRVIR